MFYIYAILSTYRRRCFGKQRWLRTWGTFGVMWLGIHYVYVLGRRGYKPKSRYSSVMTSKKLKFPSVPTNAHVSMCTWPELASAAFVGESEVFLWTTSNRRRASLGTSIISECVMSASRQYDEISQCNDTWRSWSTDEIVISGKGYHRSAWYIRHLCRE